jgi:hypothetical protein
MMDLNRTYQPEAGHPAIVDIYACNSAWLAPLGHPHKHHIHSVQPSIHAQPRMLTTPIP